MAVGTTSRLMCIPTTVRSRLTLEVHSIFWLWCIMRTRPDPQQPSVTSCSRGRHTCEEGRSLNRKSLRVFGLVIAVPLVFLVMTLPDVAAMVPEPPAIHDGDVIPQ